jgi:hypothetical protein
MVSNISPAGSKGKPQVHPSPCCFGQLGSKSQQKHKCTCTPSILGHAAIATQQDCPKPDIPCTTFAPALSFSRSAGLGTKTAGAAGALAAGFSIACTFFSVTPACKHQALSVELRNLCNRRIGMFQRWLFAAAAVYCLTRVRPAAHLDGILQGGRHPCRHRGLCLARWRRRRRWGRRSAWRPTPGQGRWRWRGCSRLLAHSCCMCTRMTKYCWDFIHKDRPTFY